MEANEQYEELVIPTTSESPEFPGGRGAAAEGWTGCGDTDLLPQHSGSRDRKIATSLMPACLHIKSARATHQDCQKSGGYGGREEEWRGKGEEARRPAYRSCSVVIISLL